MKRFLFGAILCFLGTAIWGFSFAYIIITSGVLNSTVFYSDIGFIGSLRVYNLLIPFIISEFTWFIESSSFGATFSFNSEIEG